MSRFLVVFGGYGKGGTSGAERMGWRTTEALRLRGHQVRVLTDAEPPEETLHREYRLFRTEDEVIRAGERPDVVHAYDLARPEQVATALRLADKWEAPFVLTPASEPRLWPDLGLGRSACRAARALYTLTAAEADAVRSFGAVPERIRPLPQAPDLVGDPRPAAFRQRHRLGGRVVLFLGRKTRTKGCDVLLDAAPLVWRTAPDTVFLFAGPDTEAPVAEAIRTHPDARVRDVGLLDEQTKHDALAACDIVCLPSSADVFPLVFAEAWACGKAVVTGDFPGVHEVVHDGVDALVAPVRPADVADALLGLLTDDARRTALGDAGRGRVRRGMTWDAVAAAVEAGLPAGDGAIDMKRGTR